MASSLTNLQMTLSVLGTYAGTAVGGIGSPTFPISLPQAISQTLSNGTNAANKANQVYVDNRTLANSVSEDINIYAPNGGNDSFGNVFTIAKLKMLLIQNLSATESDYLSIGGKGASSGWTSFFGTNTDLGKLYGGGTLLLWEPGAAAYAVGASTTNHLLTILSTSAVSINYNIIVVGSTS